MFAALNIAVFAVVFTILISEGNIFEFYGRLLERLPDWLAKPLGDCPRCMAGQIALWSYFFMEGYNFIDHVFFIVWAIFFTEIIILIYGKLHL